MQRRQLSSTCLAWWQRERLSVHRGLQQGTFATHTGHNRNLCREATSATCKANHVRCCVMMWGTPLSGMHINLYVWSYGRHVMGIVLYMYALYTVCAFWGGTSTCRYNPIYVYIPRYHGNRKLRNLISAKSPELLSWPVRYYQYRTGQILISHRSTMKLQLSLRNSKQVNNEATAVTEKQ